MQALPNGYVVLPGLSEITVYEDEVQQVLDLVRDEREVARIAVAETEFKKRLQQYADEKCGGNLADAMQLCPESVQSVYCQQNRGDNVIGTKPLLSAILMDEKLPPPQLEASSTTVHLLGAILGNPDILQALRAALNIDTNSKQEQKALPKKN